MENLRDMTIQLPNKNEFKVQRYDSMVPDVYKFSSKCNVQSIFFIWITYFWVDCASTRLVTKLDRSMMSSLKPKIEYANEGWPLTVFHIDREFNLVVEKKTVVSSSTLLGFQFYPWICRFIYFFPFFLFSKTYHTGGVVIVYVTQGIFSDCQ